VKAAVAKNAELKARLSKRISFNLCPEGAVS
jgi:hypothetical protein